MPEVGKQIDALRWLNTGTPGDYRKCMHALCNMPGVIIQDAKRFEPSQTFDVAVCIGSTHALGGYLPTLKALIRWVKPGGFIAVGEGFWTKRPARRYLRVLKGRRDEFTTHEKNITRAEALGLIPWWCVASSPDEWDEYEWSWSGSLAAWALDHPDEPGSGEALATASLHRTEWLRGYRGTLGFVTLVLRRTTS